MKGGHQHNPGCPTDRCDQAEHEQVTQIAEFPTRLKRSRLHIPTVDHSPSTVQVFIFLP
ncbi:MAG: hypothetical protein ACJ8CB_15245 [Ktedonobacteraceae bacterium]